MWKPMPQLENPRLRNFKNNGRGQDEMRRRRQEVTVELRKKKKDMQLLKRRNVEDDENLDQSTSQDREQFLLNPEEILKKMKSNDPQLQVQATQTIRKILSRERKPPIDAVISSGIVPLLVEFLELNDNSILQFEAAWALTNISSGSSVQTLAVVNAKAVPAFVKLLSSPNENVAEQAVWALGNIAGDGPTLRDFVIQSGAILPLLNLIAPTSSESVFRNVTWTLSNFCRGKVPPPPPEVITYCLPILARLLCCEDTNVLSDACWAFSYLTDTSEQFIEAVVEVGVIPNIVHLLGHDNLSVLTPALRALGNIVTGNDIQTQAVIDAGVVPLLGKLLTNPKSNIQKETAWMLSNIAAGTPQQIQCVLDCDLLPKLIDLLSHGDYKVQKEILWVLTNLTTGGTPDQIGVLLDHGVLPIYANMLSFNDTRVVQLVLDGLKHILENAKSCKHLERICAIIEECGALDLIENLQSHENALIYKQALDLIENYFGEENEDPNVVPPGAESSFDFTVTSVSPSTGGYSI